MLFNHPIINLIYLLYFFDLFLISLLNHLILWQPPLIILIFLLNYYHQQISLNLQAQHPSQLIVI